VRSGDAVYRSFCQLFGFSKGTTAITPADIQIAKEILIQRQDTHLDSLAERLREPRVRAIVEPMLAGQELGNIPNDDIQFVQDLGWC
jgi:hypothetical protein